MQQKWCHKKYSRGAIDTNTEIKQIHIHHPEVHQATPECTLTNKRSFHSYQSQYLHVGRPESAQLNTMFIALKSSNK